MAERQDDEFDDDDMGTWEDAWDIAVARLPGGPALYIANTTG
jgi:hypothetical protein